MRVVHAAAALAAAWMLAGCDGPERTTVRRPAEPPAAPVVVAPPVAIPSPMPPPAPPAQASAQGAPTPQPAPPVASPPPGAADGTALLARKRLMVPVVGIAPAALHDTYRQARGGGLHEAMDILAPEGTPVVAVEEGRVAKLFTSKGGGGLTVYHFDPQGRLAYYYAHLARYADGLKEGDALRKGQVIGYVGHTGNADPKAPHLHFAVFQLGPDRRWWEGEPLNPYPALRAAEPAQALSASR